MANENDASGDYQQHRTDLTGKTQESYVQEWLKSNGGPVDVGLVTGTGPEQSTKLEPFPTDRPAPPKQSTGGKIMRNVGEIVPQAVRGVEEAVYNAFGPFNSAVDWLNENVADLRYSDLSKGKPETLAGNLANDLSQFFTGMIPVMRGLQATSLSAKAGPAATNMIAGALADFAVRDGRDGRFVDLLNRAGIPKNVVTDYLASNDDDSEALSRFKGAVDGAMTGLLATGVLKVAGALRAARKASKAVQTQADEQRLRWGEVTDEQRVAALGDNSRPLVERIAKPVTSSTDSAGNKWTVQAVAIKEGEKPLYFKITDAEGRELAHADFVEEGGKLMSESVQVDKSLKGQGIAEMLYRAASEKYGMPIVPGRMQTTEGAGFVKAMQAKGVIEGGNGPTAEAVIGGRGTVKAGGQDFYINFSRIDKPDDVKDAIATMAQAYKGQINEATRGKISQAETARMADDLGMTVDDLMTRRRGQPFNAEEAFAARQILNASADNLIGLARKASSADASTLDQFAFRRAMATHAAIQSEVFGARTETARALASWKIPAGSGVEQSRAVQQAMEEFGGVLESKEMAARLAILADQVGPKAVAQFAEKGWGAKSMDAIKELWVNWLLTGPASHATNIVSNTGVAMQSIVERGVAAKIGQIMGTEGGVAPGEALAMAYGTVTAIKKAFVASGRALKTGEVEYGASKVELPRVPAVSTEALQIASDTGLGRAVDLIGNVNRIPTRLLMAEDAFAKTIGYQAELHALAARKATGEGLTGPDYWKRINEIVLDPPAELKISAADAALYRTFNDAPGEFGKAMMKLRDSSSAVFFIFPFLRTPLRIAHYTFERTPFAPLMSSFRADVAAGGARSDLALAKMATGSAIMAAALDWADSGLLTGRGTKNLGQREAQSRQGRDQYSARIGDRMYNISRLDPYGAQLGFAADVAEMIRNKEISEDDEVDISEALTMGIAAISQLAINKTYMRGASEFFTMMHDGQRYGEQYIRNWIASFVPMTSLSGAIERAVDPVLREQSGLMDAAYAKLAGISEKLPPKLTLWGDEVRLESGLGKVYDFLSPVRATEVKPIPVDMEIDRLSPLAAADNVEGGFQRIKKRTSFMGMEVNFKDYPEAYTEYVRLAGNALRLEDADGKGAKDFLNETVQGRGSLGETYRRLPDIDRIRLISTVITKYRKAAQAELYNDPKFADFARHVDATREIMLLRHQAEPAGVVQ